ncbi:hypothetical protein EDB81DRAFT_819415 [Dactylonectria macrodidyma]|uniref:DNA/RNA-binding domain-containing protein n=1 Tax=Dactylonectria macrodidyma TaxID=307937 RepID=A0A9P9D9S5_9HYPO|nr:hypothetical protein EDB81DRAFT_819415 [Dactylonectria macrodidyma]
MVFTKKWVTHLRNKNRQDVSSQKTFSQCSTEVASDLESLHPQVSSSQYEGDESHISMNFKKWMTHLWNKNRQNVSSQKGLSQCSSSEVPSDLESLPSRLQEKFIARLDGDTDEDVDDAFNGSQKLRASNAIFGCCFGGAQSASKNIPKRNTIPKPAVVQVTQAATRPASDDDPKKRSQSSATNQPTQAALLGGPRVALPRGSRGRQMIAFPHRATLQPSNKTARPSRHSSQPNEAEPPQMILQPETKPISQAQLVAEVKGIYAGLIMVEAKCIEVDNAQSSNTTDADPLNNEQWQALIALHRTLLHEHHDFFLASQHPSASVPLRGLASKYDMPARMWRHGIHSFLELLRHRLPASLEHILTFLCLAYSMTALLYETVPAFEETWIECLGDLGRYRMVIEDDDIKDREVWTGVSRHWYSKASDKSPTTGRLYHHLAILARPNALQQLYYYAKSLCVPIPFLSTKESIMTLFDPVLGSNTTHLAPIDAAFVRVHGIFFSGKSEDKLEDSIEEFLSLLDNHISRTTRRWLEAGYFIGIAIGCSLLGYGADSNILTRAMSQRLDETDTTRDGSTIPEVPPGDTFKKSLSFAVRTYEIVTTRWGDANILPFVHTTLVFIEHMTRYPTAMSYLEREYPWKLTAAMLNYILASGEYRTRMDGNFPGLEKDEPPRPLPEDYAMRGLTYAEDYHPKE